jgi:glyoxylase-like metal-dependent hydrolase (beta-lactamase superfamily II)
MREVVIQRRSRLNSVKNARPGLAVQFNLWHRYWSDKALERLGIKPDKITDVILMHMHSDHVDGH